MLAEYLPTLGLLARLSLGSVGILTNELREGIARGSPPEVTTYVSHHVAMLARENLIAAKLLQTLASHRSLAAPEWLPEIVKNCLKELHDYMVQFTDQVPYDNYDTELKYVRAAIEGGEWELVGDRPIKAGTVSLIFELKQKEGAARAVGKIIRTGVRSKLDGSLDEVKPLIDLLSLWSDAGEVEAVAEEIFSSLKQQTQLKDEAANCEQFRKLCVNVEGLRVPRVLNVESNDFVIFEYLEGKPVTEIDHSFRDRFEAWSKIWVKSFIVPAITDGKVHGDMHAGNFLFDTESGSVGIVDFGVVYSASIEEAERIERTINDLLLNVDDVVDLVEWISTVCVDGLFVPHSVINSLDESVRKELKGKVSRFVEGACENNLSWALFSPNDLWQEVRSTQGCESLTLNAYGMKVWHALTSGLGVLLALCDGDWNTVSRVVKECISETFELGLLGSVQ
jgi:hypothetical protein